MYYSNTYLEDLETIISKPLPFEQLKGKGVLITGANGLIGSCIADSLIKINDKYDYKIKVLALCRNKEKARKRFESYGSRTDFELIEADVIQPLSRDISCDYIIHAASNAHPVAYAKEPVDTMKANILGTVNLLEHAKNYGLQRFLFISSSEVYGENINQQRGFKEEDPGYINSMSDRACYPESKRAAEAFCVSYSKQFDIDTVIARPGYIYGITMNEENSRADIQFIRRALQGQDIVMKSSGSQLRSYCYLSDAAAAIFYILLRGNKREAYNIANKNCNISISDFAHALAKEANVEVIYENPSDLEKQGFSKVMNSVLDTDKLNALGWEAGIDLKTGMQRLINGLRGY